MSSEADVKCEMLQYVTTGGSREPCRTARSIRVLYCILDNRFGGPHRRALTMARHLQRHGVETVFLTGWKSADPWRPEGFMSFACRNIQCINRHRPMRNLARFSVGLRRTVAEIRRLIADQRIDIVHVDGVTNFVPALAARRSGIPVVWTYNDHPPAPLRPMLHSLVGALASRVIVQGQALRQTRTAACPKLHDKTTVLPGTVDTSRFAPAEHDAEQRQTVRNELGVPPDGLLVGTVGNMNRFKGHRYLLEAAARMREQMDAIRFVIVGRELDTDAAYRRELKELTARLGLRDRVVFAGFREDVPAILSALDLFVLPSALESCPIALLEAMAMRVPVVATDVGAVGDMVVHGETGLLVPPRKPQALADAMLTILRMQPEEVRTMTQTARERIEQGFGPDAIALRQWRIYESVRRPDVSHA